MSERYNWLTVALQRDIRDDDAELIIKAISQIKGVLKVEAHVADIEQFFSVARAKSELREKLWKIIAETDDV